MGEKGGGAGLVQIGAANKHYCKNPRRFKKRGRKRIIKEQTKHLKRKDNQGGQWCKEVPLTI